MFEEKEKNLCLSRFSVNYDSDIFLFFFMAEQNQSSGNDAFLLDDSKKQGTR